MNDRTEEIEQIAASLARSAETMSQPTVLNCGSEEQQREACEIVDRLVRLSRLLDQHHEQLSHAEISVGIDLGHALLDQADRLLARQECLDETGSEPFATAACPAPDCGQFLAIPKGAGPGAGIECTACDATWTPREVISR